MGVCLSVCWLRMVVGMCAGHRCVQVEGGGVLVMYVVVSGCVGRCGSPWGAALAGHGVTACKVLVESPGWLVEPSWLFAGCSLSQLG